MADAPYLIITDTRRVDTDDSADAGDAPDAVLNWTLGLEVRFVPRARDMTLADTGEVHQIDDITGIYNPDGELRRYATEDSTGSITGYGPAGVSLPDLASSLWESPFNADEASWEVTFNGATLPNYGKFTPRGGPIRPGYEGETRLGALLPQAVVNGVPVVKGPAGAVDVGTTETLPAGEPAVVSARGTRQDRILDFALPKGDQGIQGQWATGAAEDVAAVAQMLQNNTAARDAVKALTETGYTRYIYVGPNGNDANSGLTMSNAKATLLGALTAMGKNVKGLICALPGEIALGAGTINWTGYKCSLVGSGALATKFTVTTQTGPMIDMTGVNYDMNGGVVGGFYLQGDGTRGVAKQGLALDPDTSIVNATFYDIEVRNTGGTCFALGYTEFATFSKLYAWQPVGAVPDDVPYISGYGAFNGNTFRDCVVHATAPTGQSVGQTGAVVIRDNGLTAPHGNNFDTFKLEHLQLPSGGTVFNIAGNDNEINHPQLFDCGKVSGATGTSYFRFAIPAVMNSGGNKYLGIVPGKGTNATDIDTGVELLQGRNAVVGVKGFKGTNVTLGANAGYCYVELHGSVAASSDPGWIDNSGVLTNHLIDRYNAVEKRPSRTITQGTSATVEDQPGGVWGPGGRRFYDPATPANGRLGLGTSGSRIEALGVNAFLTGDSFTMRTIGLVNLMQAIGKATDGSGVRGVRLYDNGALTSPSASWRGVIAFVQGDTTTADRLVICRKDAAGAYAWVDLF